MDQMRRWQGPAILSYGFRPFFFGGALYAALIMGLWVPWYLGFVVVPSAFPPTAWHVHEILFGFVPAIVAGFLLTAVPNWTGRLPVTGLPLAALFALWLAGRLVVAFSLALDPLLTAAVTLAFPTVLVAVAAREIVAGKNWRNLKVLATVLVFVAGQALFHYELWRYGWPAYGDRLAIAATVFLILIIGGRIVPSFTLNWIKRANPGREPAAFDRFDRWSLVLSGAALAAWTGWPAVPAAGPWIAGLLATAGGLNLWRLLRWAPDRTLREPLVTVLHIAFFFVPVGFLLAGAAVWDQGPALASASVHTWTVGAIGLMTLAVMTRASRGHSGRPLTAPPGTVAIYASMLVAALARVAGALLPEHTLVLMPLAGLAWIAALLGFAALYGPMLVLPRADR